MNKFNQLLFLLAVLASQSVLADRFNLPVSSNSNANPFVQIHGLPGFTGVNQLDSGEYSSQVLLEVSNEFFRKSAKKEQLVFDYERTTLSLDLAYGLNDKYSVGLKIPYMINSGGFLDGVIENWHDLFGLSQGGRDNADRDNFLISYVSENQSILVDNTEQGLGDISVYADRSIVSSENRKMKTRATLKFPTGDGEQLLGSGGYSFSLSLNAAAGLTDNIVTFAAAGISYLSQGDVLNSGQNDLVATATFGLGWEFKPQIMLSAQVDLNSKVYADTDLDAISGQAGVLYVSAQYKFSNQSSLQLGFTEDVINKDAAPDFGLKFGFSF